MSQSSFYVTLPSNGSKQYYSNNTASVFRNQLIQSIQLDGRWEVALVEMQYPLSWKIITNKNVLGAFFIHKLEIGNRQFVKRKALFTLKAGVLVSVIKSSDVVFDNYTLEYVQKGMINIQQNGYMSTSPEDSEIKRVLCSASDNYVLQIFVPANSEYKSVTYAEVEFESSHFNSTQDVASVVHTEMKQAIIQALNIENPEVLNKYQAYDILLDTVFGVDNRLNEYYSNYRTISGLVGFKSSKELLQVLGFTTPSNEVDIIQFPKETSNKGPGLKFKSPALYVYTDIIADDFVGDVKIPLLRAVGIEGDRGDFANKEFIHPHYKPLKTGYINSIRIEVKDDTGQDIDFTVGKVICTLHFRRCGLEV